jgi:hypothetical protein
LPLRYSQTAADAGESKANLNSADFTLNDQVFSEEKKEETANRAERSGLEGEFFVLPPAIPASTASLLHRSAQRSRTMRDLLFL